MPAVAFPGSRLDDLPPVAHQVPVAVGLGVPALANTASTVSALSFSPLTIFIASANTRSSQSSR